MFEKELSSAKSIKDLNYLIEKNINNSQEVYNKILGIYLMNRIKENISYANDNLKFVVYPDDSGVDVYFGDDTSLLKEKFGWKFYEIKI